MSIAFRADGDLHPGDAMTAGMPKAWPQGASSRRKCLKIAIHGAASEMVPLH
jgi:hypothetical protein